MVAPKHAVTPPAALLTYDVLGVVQCDALSWATERGRRCPTRDRPSRKGGHRREDGCVATHTHLPIHSKFYDATWDHNAGVCWKTMFYVRRSAVWFNHATRLALARGSEFLCWNSKRKRRRRTNQKTFRDGLHGGNSILFCVVIDLLFHHFTYNTVSITAGIHYVFNFSYKFSLRNDHSNKLTWLRGKKTPNTCSKEYCYKN